jgi:hypothetical protein
MILFDAHVHIHDRFNPAALFDAAYRNFCSVGKSLGAAFFLLLTEGEKQHQFKQLRDGKNPCGDWQILSTGESFSLRLEKRGNTRSEMFLVAGRQLVTAERLEVLALLTGEQFEEGLPLARTVDEVRRLGALPALPWGAGKWLGRRKRVLSRFFQEETIQPLFLADNRCRPRLWPFPDFARKTSLKILAGTDPLPFPWEERRAGSYGCMLANDAALIDKFAPAAGLRRLLLDPWSQPVVYGQPEATLDFFKNQTAMQIHKHLPRRGSS